jgi:hypothetical protein
MKDAWDYIYGSKSHMNLAGKILLGVPLAPFVFVFVVTWVVLDWLFLKRST